MTWKVMTPKQFKEWLQTCPTPDYLVVEETEGLRTVNFCVEENKDD